MSIGGVLRLRGGTPGVRKNPTMVVVAVQPPVTGTVTFQMTGLIEAGSLLGRKYYRVSPEYLCINAFFFVFGPPRLR